MHTKKDSKMEEKPIAEQKDIRRVGNRVYFYAEVNQETISALLEEIFAADRELNELYSFPYIKPPDDYNAPPIIIEINSPGGDAVEMFRYLDKIGEIKSPIWTVCAGMCASAATIIAVSADYRLMYPRGFYHVHSLSAGNWGKYEELYDRMEFLTKLQDEAVRVYTKSNSKGKTEEEIRALMAREKSLTAEEALEYGFIDKIIGRD